MIFKFLMDTEKTKTIFDHFRNVGICVALILGAEGGLSDYFASIDEIVEQYVERHEKELQPLIEVEEKVLTRYNAVVEASNSHNTALANYPNQSVVSQEEIQKLKQKVESAWNDSYQKVKELNHWLDEQQNSYKLNFQVWLSLILYLLAFILLWKNFRHLQEEISSYHGNAGTTWGDAQNVIPISIRTSCLALFCFRCHR
ncbi:hypothetical protein D1115_08840 [Vibrio alfacsensis]|uniref:Uncharacterized protein n=1 Tax=Vibrio alfacsensis TaxID=1074311 RepID=A0ABN5PGI9_9VIBR|nr:hypothetical protein [Vibrio alfacsensis]AXY01271.1 hypothetical protein D1115_08840 [Vibrio alfacsensis]